MKKILLIAAFIISSFTYGQVSVAKALKLVAITTAQRDALTINTNEFPVIYNFTTGDFERYNGATWESWGAGGGGTPTWGFVTGTLSDQTDLQAALDLKANLSGATFTGDINVPAEAYGVGWNGSTEVPTKDALYDKIETVVSGGGAASLTDLSDVNTATTTNRNVLVADGIDFESRALVEADISDLSHIANTDAQDLTLVGNTLAISGDPNTDVDLSGYLDNADTQDLSLATNTLSLVNGGNVDLTPYTTLGVDGDKGDITVGGTGTTLTIDAGAIDETQLDASTNASLNLADSASQTDDQTATEVPFTPYSTIASTDVQTAIQEVLDETTAVVLETTSTAVDLSSINGNYAYASAATTSNTFTVTGAVTGGWAAVLVDTTGDAVFPTVTGSTLTNSAPFEAAVEYYLMILNNGARTEHYFVKRDVGTTTYLESGDIDTLAELNAIVTDATLITDATSDGSEYVRKDGAWAVASGGDLTFLTPVTNANSSTITLDNVGGDRFVTSANAATDYTVTIGSATVGAWAKILINAATEPTVNTVSTGKVSGSAFETSTDMLMIIYTDDGTAINYFFSTLTGAVGGGGDLSTTDIDTFAELDAIVADESLVNTNDAQTLTNKTFTDNVFSIADNLDATKIVQFQASALATGQTRTMTIPNGNGTVSLTELSETLLNKTLNSPILVTPALGTPSSGVATNLTGTAAGLTVGATTGVEAGADVTDTANVTAAGALMDSEVDADIQTMTIAASSTISGSNTGDQTATADTPTTVVTLDSELGRYGNMGSANTTATYTTTGTTTGAWAKLLVQTTTSHPTVTGATLETGAAWEATTDFYMVVYHDGTGVKYYFIKK